MHTQTYMQSPFLESSLQKILSIPLPNVKQEIRNTESILGILALQISHIPTCIDHSLGAVFQVSEEKLSQVRNQVSACAWSISKETPEENLELVINAPHRLPQKQANNNIHLPC